MTLRPDPFTEIREARELAEGCDVHGVGFICRHEWETLEGPAFDGGEHARAKALDAARKRLAESVLAALDGLEREAAEREAALAENEAAHQALDDFDAPRTEPHFRSPYMLSGRIRSLRSRLVVEGNQRAGKFLKRAEDAEARVREVEAERDRANHEVADAQTYVERASRDAAAAEVERDRLRRAYEAAKITAECGLQHAEVLRMDTAEDEAARKLIVATIQKGLQVAAVLASPEAPAEFDHPAGGRTDKVKDGPEAAAAEPIEEYAKRHPWMNDAGAAALSAVDAPPETT